MDFREMVYQQQFDKAEKDMKRKRREGEQARKCIAELDRIFKRIYERMTLTELSAMNGF